MILIISNHNDYSTTQVIRWLIKLKVKFVRINDKDKIEILNLTNSSFKFKHQDNIYSLNDFDSVWYRRGNLDFELSSELEYLKYENREIKMYIHKLLWEKKHINSYLKSDVNKLFILNYKNFNAVKLPEFCITDSKKVALDFFEKHNGQILSKPVYSPFKANNNDKLFMSYTSKLSINDIESVSKKFVPTFFQRYEEKKFEIRSFYLDGSFHSMCIFSQKNEKTKVDFRNYDTELPNRVTPFMLPENIKIDLDRMFKDFKLNCASVDIIFNESGYHLIDVNPIGQFGMVSYPCNYSLEKRIAKYLSCKI